MESVAMDYHVNYKISHGIYFGNAVINNTIVRRNTVSGCNGGGIHVDHTMVSSGIQVRDNVLYDNDIQLSLSDYSNYNGPGATPPYHVPSYNSVYSGNTLYCMNKDQLCVTAVSCVRNTLVDFGTFTNNRHFNPFNELTTLSSSCKAGRSSTIRSSAGKRSVARKPVAHAARIARTATR